MWLILRLKMSCFNLQGLLGGDGGGRVMVLCPWFGLWNKWRGAGKKNTPNNRGLPKKARGKYTIDVPPLLYTNYEPSIGTSKVAIKFKVTINIIQSLFL